MVKLDTIAAYPDVEKYFGIRLRGRRYSESAFDLRQCVEEPPVDFAEDLNKDHQRVIALEPERNAPCRLA